MNSELDHATTGGQINCALYLAGVIFSGALVGNHAAVLLALLSASVSVLGYSFVIAAEGFRGWILGLFLSSWALALAAGVFLLVGYLRG